MRRGTVVVTLPRGTQIFLRAWLTETDAEQSMGLGGVPPLRESETMVFRFPPGSRPAFHTQSMLGPLDFVFAAEGVVHSVVRRVPPGRTRIEVLPASDTVLELPGGSLDLLGIGPGAALGLLARAFPDR